jgi:hypothetical protein
MRTLTLIDCVLPRPLDDAVLQHAQQLDLHVERQLANLVQEQRRAVGCFEASDLTGERARIRAPLPAEQLAFDERRWNRGAADANHGSAAARAELMQRLSEDFLPRSGFANQQDSRRRRRYLLELLEGPPNRRALRHDAVARPCRANRRHAWAECVHGRTFDRSLAP